MADIMTILKKATSLQEVIDKLIEELTKEYEQTRDLKIKEKCSAIMYYNQVIHNKSLIATHRKAFNGLYSALDKSIPELLFTLDGNKKSFKAFLEKLDMLQEKNASLASAYKDIHRFRIVTNMSNVDNQETIENLYLTTVLVIKFFLESGYTLCEAPIRNDTEGFTKKEHPKIFVPKETIIPEEYISKVKDYVRYPKKSGYQCIHLLFADKQNNLFEVQLRTFPMHVHAEYGKDAAHSQFKQDTRAAYNWDLSKINIPGFQYIEIEDVETGKIKSEILDNVGLVKPVSTFMRRKTFS